ncbi:MAG: leucine-rich repeat domain-containing protein, partial [Candidatus Cloacimonas sp.]|nr:leucine-rich repeat domain-containing protein [Candidatus Cloacimonas sp.]
MKSPKLRSLPLGLILFFLCFSISPCLAQFGGGTGSVASPYLVATAQHLSNVRDYADAYFLQTGDIFLNVEPYNSGQGWLPIGNQTAPFTGSYDGNSFHIYSLYINQPEGKNLGLFGYTNSAVLKNIALNNVNISGKDYIGSLVGSVNGSFIQSCSCDGTITGVSVTGGLVGALELSCHLEKCSADCVVSGQFSIGGLCGYSKGASEIFTSFSKGTVTGDNATGGLVGMQGNSTISQSFSASAVQGNWGAGGLLGVNDTQSLVSNCYSIGFVTGNSNTGGLIGRNVVSQTLSSYWNLESSGQVTSAGGIGKTTDEMTFPYAANTYEDWNLTEIWQPDTEYFVNAGYPYLQWMYPCPPVSHLSYLIENYSVILQWSPPYVSSYTGFNVYKNGELYTAVTDSFFIDTDVYHGEQYTYQVSVVYEGGESSLSEPVSFYVYFPPLPANCVFPLNGSTEMDILPLIHWSPDAHHNYPLPDGYLLEVWALSGTHVVDEDVGNVTSYQITNPLDYETEYYWNVTPYTFGEENTRLYAENVPNWYFITQEQIVKPVNLTATIENWKNVQLNWNLDERSLQNFNIYRNGTLIGNSYYPFYYDENLSQGEYSYYVTALYETAESEPSNTAGVTIAYIFPPQNVYAALIDSVLQLSWQPSVSGLEQGYALYRLQEGQENEPYLWEQIGYTTDEFTFYDSNWQNLPTGDYKWAIIAHYDYDNYSEPAFSNVIYKVVNLIPDDNFRRAINIALHHPSDYIPTIADLNGLTGTLYAGQRSIVSIEGAQYLTNLQLLDLRYNQIIDLSPLAGLINLHELDINHNQISDLSPLAGLTNMRYLYLHWNQISGLSPLVGLTNLKLLWLYNNQISDLSPLEGLTNLQELWLNDNQIGDLSPLVGLTYLQELWIHNNQISDLSPLEELINLLSLCLTNNQISDLSPLAGLANLQELWLNNNPLSNLSPLEGLTHLQLLHLDDNQISDLSPLAELINLQELYLSDNQISEISPLSGLTNLKKLNLCYNRISDLNPLVGLANLIYLYLYGNQISDLSPLAGLTNLQDLWLFINNPISYESMWLSRSWSLPWSTNEYNPLSPCYPVPNRNAVNVSTNCDLSWQGNYYYSQDVFYEVWLGFSPYNLSYIGSGNHISGTQYSFNVALQPNTQYYWRVKAIAPSDTIWSGMWNFTTGESYYQPIISVTPTSIYDELTTAETSQTEITIANNGTAPLIWNSNIILIRAEQKTGTNAYLTKENNTTRELHPKIENTADNNIRYKDTDRDGISIMPEINLSPSFGTIEPNSSVICILNFIPGDSLGIYNYELQLSSNDPVSPLVTVPAEYVVTSPIAYIPDDNFRMVINGALGQPSDYQPTIADLNGLTGYLDADERNITSIEGAQYLTNLQELYLYYNQISDISPLAGLSNLQRLDFGCNQISDLSPLEGLTNLQFLWLNDNQISNLSPLTGLFNMQVLYLNHNQISDLSPLAWLTTLQYLNLSGNHISDLSPLEGLIYLQQLDLSWNQISDLSPLAGLNNLQALYLWSNQISNLNPLAWLTTLQYLNLSGNHISDLSPLEGLTNLQYLNLNGNQISNLSPLANLTNLYYLYLVYNHISDLSPLAGLTNLQSLYLQQNQISDISPLVELTNLRWLDINYNPISYESMLLSQSWSLPWSTNEYNSLSPCYPVPNRNATNVLVNYPLSWQGNYNNSQDVFYEVWLGVNP